MPESEPSSVVLLVDDSPEDSFLLGFAFAQAGIGENFRTVPSGRQALHYLEGKAEFADRDRFPLPCLLLLAITSFGMDGFRILEKIRAHPKYRHLPVSMYSSSGEEKDIKRALRLGADCYVEKPLTFPARLEFARNIAATWFTSRTLPHARPRILLRKCLSQRNAQQAGFYLQPTGDWSKNRKTARHFTHTVDAHWWAKEQECLDAEVVLAYSDPDRDYGCMRT